MSVQGERSEVEGGKKNNLKKYEYESDNPPRYSTYRVPYTTYIHISY